MLAVNKFMELGRAVTRSSLLWGALATVGFFVLVGAGAFSVFGAAAQEFVRRYCANHPVQYVEVTMFFVGMAALMLKWGDVMEQLKSAKTSLLGGVPENGQTADDCPALLAKLDEAPREQQQSYLVRRLRDGLEHVRLKGSADSLDDELKYLSDADDSRAYTGYALVRIIIWAIPILGFLGTVIGITLAIASLDPAALENSLNDVVLGLAVAFDTTALALSLSIVLMFTQFACDRAEHRLLARVDEHATDELTGRFLCHGTSGDPQSAALRRMSEMVIEASGRLVEKQAQLWEGSMEIAQRRWSEAATAAQRHAETVLAKATSQSLEAHADKVAEAAEHFARQNQELWTGVQASLDESTQAVVAQQSELIKQGEVLLRVVESTGQVAKLEETLNRNLESLAGSQNFEETVQSLAAVIHLLNTRIGRAA